MTVRSASRTSSCCVRRVLTPSRSQVRSSASTRRLAARTRFGALMSGLRQFGERAPAQAEDLANAIAEVHPTCCSSMRVRGALRRRRSAPGLPWAFSLVSAMPLTSRDAPPFGLGLRPRHDAVGRVRDRVLGRLDARDAGADHRLTPEPTALGTRRAAVPKDRPVLPRRRPSDRVHRRTVRIPPLRLVAQGSPRRPRALGAARRARQHGSPMSTGRSCLSPARPCFRTTARSPRSRARRSTGSRLDAVITTVEIDPASFKAPANVRIERFVPALAVLDARGLRGLPRRHGHHPEGARPRRTRRRRPVRARPARSGPPRRSSPCGRAAARAQAHPSPSPNRRPRRDQPPTGSAAHRRRVRSSGRPEPRPTRSRHSLGHPRARDHPTGANTAARCGPRTRATRRPVPGGRRPSGRGLE